MTTLPRTSSLGGRLGRPSISRCQSGCQECLAASISPSSDSFSISSSQIHRTPYFLPFFLPLVASPKAVVPFSFPSSIIAMSLYPFPFGFYLFCSLYLSHSPLFHFLPFPLLFNILHLPLSIFAACLPVPRPYLCFFFISPCFSSLLLISSLSPFPLFPLSPSPLPHSPTPSHAPSSFPSRNGSIPTLSLFLKHLPPPLLPDPPAPKWVNMHLLRRKRHQIYKRNAQTYIPLKIAF